MASEPSLYIKTEIRDYNASQFNELLTRTQRQEQLTLPIPAASAEALCMNYQGQLPEGYRYTSTAFRYACIYAANGLSRLVLHLAGVRRDRFAPEESYSLVDAIDVFNLTVRRKFTSRGLDRCLVVQNANDHLIEGFLGPGFSPLDNGMLLELSESLAGTAATPLYFHMAHVNGRRLLARFLAPEPTVRYVNRHLGGVDAYRMGFQVSNSSISGESVRVYPILCREYDKSVILGKVSSTAINLRHGQKKLVEKLRGMFMLLLRRLPEMDKLSSRFDALQDRPLGFDVRHDVRKQQIERLAEWMYRSSITKLIARDVLSLAIRRGSGEEEVADATMLTQQEMAERNWCDLLHAAMRHASRLPWAKREMLERFAFRLLMKG